ncbi:putative membrane protein containing SNARE associated protein domain [Sulfurimonas gotlandica GD1]|uniref:Putative membrane protein containing SNARE associated protein domain n=1 Tax=Sulfurimonas gotlandica (strain DSM 19862 / JCM 16533 / GD1) TaxID=929558 RepID=B6BKF5_SULGG|nr:VTT domain-containing protein [Sulfurimonas gotlandica]EDZ62395.1 SNARE associated Golgi protein [Sulfurimonas gotlandica GD1]EHP29010.1 putative membrane protein containing SNARE associated protein domain [Sulfurimonas gotlandica GD1]
MLDFILDSYQYIEELSIAVKVLIVIFLSVISPILFIPIMATMYLSGLLLGFNLGVIIATIGYFLSISTYYYIGSSFHKISFIKRLIDARLGKHMSKLKKMNFVHVIIFSLFVPFLLISLGLGVLHKNKINIFAVYFGALPSIIAFVLAGSYGKSFFEAKDNNMIYYSLGLIVLYVILQKMFTLYLKRKG